MSMEPQTDRVEVEVQSLYKISPHGREEIAGFLEEMEASEGVRGEIEMSIRDGVISISLPPTVPDPVIREIEGRLREIPGMDVQDPTAPPVQSDEIRQQQRGNRTIFGEIFR